MAITDNLVSSYPQNNSWNDAWGTNNITAYGATFNASGKINQCGQFDGVDDYGDAGQNSSLKPASALTLVTWGMYTGAGAGSLPGFICCNAGADVATGYFLCRVASTNKVRFYIWTGSAWVYAESNSALTQNQFYLIIGRWDGGATNEVALWIDDVKQTITGTAASISYAANTALEFGVYNRQTGAPSWGAVRLDSSLLYNVAKSTADMTALWNSGNGVEITAGGDDLSTKIIIPSLAGIMQITGG